MIMDPETAALVSETAERFRTELQELHSRVGKTSSPSDFAAAKAKNVIRGYLGPDSPWFIRSVQGSLKSNGALTVTVSGLVLPDGTNPVPFFRAALSCQSPTDSTKGKLFFTKTFPADTKGNSNIVGTVSLPSQCIAPIILVTSPALAGNPLGFLFAVTGK
jgi:hypothetical protein